MIQLMLVVQTVILILVTLTCVHLFLRLTQLERVGLSTRADSPAIRDAMKVLSVLPENRGEEYSVLLLTGTCASCTGVALALDGVPDPPIDYIVVEEGIGDEAMAAINGSGVSVTVLRPGQLSEYGIRLAPLLVDIRDGVVVSSDLGDEIKSKFKTLGKVGAVS